MLSVFSGTDRQKARAALDAAIKKLGEGRERVYLNDANSAADLEAALRGGGMFPRPRAVILDDLFENDEFRERILENLPAMRDSSDAFFIFEEKLDAAAKRAAGKYAEKVETFNAPKKEKDNAIFKLRFALERGDKKTLWVGLMREFAAGKAPEAVHGFLFWAAKQMVLNARGPGLPGPRARVLLARLAELPQESRRRGVELDYALERFVLSEV